MRGRHAYMLSSIASVKYTLEEAPKWMLTAIIVWVSAIALGRGFDLALDPTTNTEVFAFANLIGANNWGWIQTVTSASVIITLALRWTVGIAAAQIASMMVWLAYSVAIFQAVIADLPTEGGLRNFFVPLGTAGWFLIAFLGTVELIRRRAATDGVIA